MASVALAVVAVSAAALPSAAAPSQPRFSTAQLSKAKTTVDRQLKAPPNGVTSWGVEPASGRVVVSVLRGDGAAMAAARKATAGLAEATITTVDERPRPFYNLVGGQAIYSANGGRCSIGFTARGAGVTYVITAGHCTELGGTWSGYNRVAIGPVSRSDFPTDDFGTIRVNSTTTWVPTAQVQGTASVIGSTEAAVGASVCRSGSTTGYRCGTIQAKNQTVNYGGGDVVYGLTKTNACAEPGDSGGSFVAGRQAQGMTSGGSGNCTSGGTTFYQPVNEVLTRYGLTLVTDPAPPTVTLCSDYNYGGRCVSTSANSANLAGSTVGDNALSSIRVPSGAWLLLYRDPNYTGICQAFNADVSFLQGTSVGNDTVSSYQIATSRGSCPA
ncbi:MAG TPA: alpha-lytic protease prodomain-containing protein [Propionibacteriaceae bacterium]